MPEKAYWSGVVVAVVAVCACVGTGVWTRADCGAQTITRGTTAPTSCNSPEEVCEGEEGEGHVAVVVALAEGGPEPLGEDGVARPARGREGLGGGPREERERAAAEGVVAAEERGEEDLDAGGQLAEGAAEARERGDDGAARGGAARGGREARAPQAVQRPLAEARGCVR